MTITAGIDAGAKLTKAVVLDGTEVVGRARARTGFDPAAAAEMALAEALAEGGLERRDLARVLTTDAVTVSAAGARGAVHLHAGVRTVVDVGAEDSHAVSVTEHGEVRDQASGDRCAAGAGTFVEAMCRALDLEIEDLGPLSLASTRRIDMNAQCAVFAESELVSLIHANVPVADIARSVHDTIAARVTTMLRRVGIAADVLLIGGLGRNVGFLRSLEDALKTPVLVPEHPEFVSALGAALTAREQAVR